MSGQRRWRRWRRRRWSSSLGDLDPGSFAVARGRDRRVDTRVRGTSGVFAVLRIAGIVSLDPGPDLPKQASLLLGIHDRPLHLDDPGLLKDDAILALGFFALLDQLAILCASLERLAGNLGMPANAAQNTVGEVPGRCSTTRGGAWDIALHFLSQSPKAI